MENSELKVAGFKLKGVWLAAALPIVSSLSGGIYFTYDGLQRFYSLESSISDAFTTVDTLDAGSSLLSSRVQTLEQAVLDNDVRGLNVKLTSITTQMMTILDQQKDLRELRSQVEKSTLVTDGIDAAISILETEVDDIWNAYDSLSENPLK